MDKKSIFTIQNDKGKEIECEILFTFDSDQTKKSYIVYTDNKKDKEGKIKTYASIYDPKGKDKTLYPIESDEEWLIIQDILASVQEKYNEEKSEN